MESVGSSRMPISPRAHSSTGPYSCRRGAGKHGSGDAPGWAGRRGVGQRGRLDKAGDSGAAAGPASPEWRNPKQQAPQRCPSPLACFWRSASGPGSSWQMTESVGRYCGGAGSQGGRGRKVGRGAGRCPLSSCQAAPALHIPGPTPPQPPTCSMVAMTSSRCLGWSSAVAARLISGMVKGWMRLSCASDGRAQGSRAQGGGQDGPLLFAGMCQAGAGAAPTAVEKHHRRCESVRARLRPRCCPLWRRTCHSHSAAMAMASARLGTTSACRAGVRSTRWSSMIWYPPCSQGGQRRMAH